MATAATAKYVIRVENKTKRAFKAIGRSLNKVRKAVFSMKAGFIAAAGIAGLGFLIKRSMNATDEMAKMSRAVGVSIEELQGLRHAAALGGLEATQLDKAVQKLAINIADMSRGVGLAKDVFEKHNISVENADGSLKSVMQVMADVADVTAGMSNATEKADLAYKLFGARGAKMINMLNGGSDAMRAAMLEAEKLGLVMSEDTAKGVEDANDAIQRLKSFLGASFRRTVAEIAPLIQLVTDRIRDWVEMKVGESGGIGNIARSMANSIVLATMAILQSFEDMANGMIEWKNTIAKAFGFQPEIDAVAEEIRQANLAINAYIMGTILDLDDWETRWKTFGLFLKEFNPWTFFDKDDTTFEENKKVMFATITALEAKFAKLEEQGKKTTQRLDFSNVIFQLDELLHLFTVNEGAVDELADAVDNLKDKLDEIKPTVWDEMKAGFGLYFKSVKEGTLSMATITKGALMSAEDAIVNMMMGVKTNWKSLFRAILADLIRLQLRKALLTAFGGFFHSGGRPPVGKASIVGERGAELFVPDSAGTIVPNDQLGGKNSHTTAEINFNVQAIDANSFNSFLINNRDTIESIINNSLLTNGTVRRTIKMTA
jgi:hypothetical protein